MGIFAGATFPCGSAMLAKWAPIPEKSGMSNFVFAGSQVSRFNIDDQGLIFFWGVLSQHAHVK